jgi:peptidoglycan/xylan/chitin deacetylase (PgdA/CDA1 family)
MATKALVGALRRFSKHALERIPLTAWELLSPRRTLALCYHLAADQRLSHLAPLYHYKTPAQLAQDLEFLRSRYTTLDLEAFVERLNNSSPSSGRTVWISFDDGLSECFLYVRPVLARFQATATFFLIANCIDNRKMMFRHKIALCLERASGMHGEELTETLGAVEARLGAPVTTLEQLRVSLLAIWTDRVGLVDELCEVFGIDVASYLERQKPYLSREQIRRLAEEGHSFGAHSLDHMRLQQLSESEQEREIGESCELVAQIIGKRPVHFAAPYTLEGLDRTRLLRLQSGLEGIGMIFGTGGFSPEPSGFFNRVVADDPRGARGASNLPILLRRAHVQRARATIGSGPYP